ncbi:uncharacterized protein LOC130662861 [Hydractinia symbiolongicarpus]|uniref:uncharacterized protein LOC130662861 n=1 Tax=Hydractinia symbiolongicarpus TaxID=13093 RepID=UPI002551B18D|nr:uncharacterized protein LOC130662861 [Hydractinia symbiolongicarpus]
MAEKLGKKTVWVKDWLHHRNERGAYNAILNELKLTDFESYRSYLRMNTDTFQKLIDIVGPKIQKQRTMMRDPISPEEKLAVTLRFLATGESYESLMYQFRIHKTTISQLIPTVCQEIYLSFKDQYLHLPNTKEKWMAQEEKIRTRWQFPNCIGAADGKHISILHPKDSGSESYNYKGFFSIVLLAIVDHDYKFCFVDVGCQGRISDGGVYRNSYFYKALENGDLNLPDCKPLPQSPDPNWAYDQNNEPIPYVFVGDDAFPLTNNCMKPFAQRKLTPRNRIFNYRLSRFRRISENAFGIWVNRFRVFSTKLMLSPEKATIITLASLVLHNMLRDLSKESYTPQGFIDFECENGEVELGRWREGSYTESIIQKLPVNRSNRATNSAEYIREVFADHFYGPGQIPWQWNQL